MTERSPHPAVPEIMRMSDLELAHEVRTACLAAARAAYEDAGLQGLCEEGRWEAAVSAIQALDLDAVARQATAAGYSPAATRSGRGSESESE